MARTQRNLRSLNIALGTFFFRYRNALFPMIFISAALALRPRIMFQSPLIDGLLRANGLMIALLGEAVRFVTIGFEYIHRGGKDGRVYAGRLVQRGVFGLVRNPMYIGNALIAIGITMYLGSPLGYFVLIPFFLFVYQALIAAEEAYLRKAFGAEYREYCAEVNRFLPRLDRVPQAFSELRFDWRRSLSKDVGTITGLAMGLILIPVLRSYFLYDWVVAESMILSALSLSVVLTALYLFLLKLKKTRQL